MTQSIWALLFTPNILIGPLISSLFYSSFYSMVQPWANNSLFLENLSPPWVFVLQGCDIFFEKSELVLEKIGRVVWSGRPEGFVKMQRLEMSRLEAFRLMD